jgi:PD-(D/E)XK endonuclease
MQWLVEAGAAVFVPVVSSPDYDLVADFGDGPLRVQVKTSTSWRLGRWEVRLATSGGNQSWTGIVKRMTADRCDYLFVHVGDGRRWWIPISAVDAGNAIRLGGPKYAQYQVDPGKSLAARPKAKTAAER